MNGMNALNLLERGAPLDPITITAELEQQNTLEQIGKTAEVVGLWESVPTKKTPATTPPRWSSSTTSASWPTPPSA